MNGKDIKNVGNAKIVSLKDASPPTQLEKDYVELYGQDFVEDLKLAFHLMKSDIKRQPPIDEIFQLRDHYHEEGDRKTVFFVDFRHEDFYSMTIDEYGNKTASNFGASPILYAQNDNNVRYLLSGVFLYDKQKTRKWLDELLEPGAKCWVEVI